jgi:hypothetical protein
MLPPEKVAVMINRESSGKLVPGVLGGLGGKL